METPGGRISQDGNADDICKVDGPQVRLGSEVPAGAAVASQSENRKGLEPMSEDAELNKQY